MCALIGVLVLYMLMPFAEPLMWAVLFTIILKPARDLLHRRLRNDTLTAAVITFLTVVLLVLPLTVASVMAFKEVVELSKYVIAKYKHISPEGIQDRLYSLFVVKHLTKYLPKGFLDTKELIKALMANLKALANFSASQVKAFFLSLGVLTSKFFIFVFAFFFLIKDAPVFGSYIYRFIPLEEEDKHDIVDSIYSTTISVVYGTVGTAVVQGAFSLVAYILLGVPYPYLWALATSYASFIPPFGASMVWFPVAVYLFLKAGWIKGLIMLALGVGVISSLDNVVKPMIMKNRVNTPYIVLFFAIFGGLLKFGFIGMFLGPIIFNLLFTLAKIYEEKVLR